MPDIKIVDETNKGYSQQILTLCQEFSFSSNLSLPKDKEIIIRVPLNYNAAFINLSPADQQSYLKEFGVNHNALFVEPNNELYSRYFILLKEDLFNGIEYHSTIFHELTHVVDFNDYFNRYGNVFLKDHTHKSHRYYYEFFFWTEFHAKFIGIKNIKKVIEENGGSIGLERMADLFIESINNQEGIFQCLYELMHFFARLANCETSGLSDFNTYIFPMDFIIKTFGESSIDLYYLFRGLKSFDEFDLKKIEIKQIIDSILY